MRNNCLTWTFFLLVSCVTVWSRPSQPPHAVQDNVMPPLKDNLEPQSEQVISVRITSSVAVGRGNKKPSRPHEQKHETASTFLPTPVTKTIPTAATESDKEPIETTTVTLPNLAGANMEFIKQLHSKKESRGLQHFERIHSFNSNLENLFSNGTEDSVAEPSVKSISEVKNDETDDNIENIPLARSVPLSMSSNNYIQGLSRKAISERGNNQRLTTVSFNIVHDTPKVTTNYNEPGDTFVTPDRPAAEAATYYDESRKFYNEPAKVYSRPAQVYSEPAKFYSEPAKVYSEPAKIYSEPSKIYSEPAKIYSEPAKFYSQPASLHLPHNRPPWQHPTVSSTIVTSTPFTTVAIPSMVPNTARIPEHQPEKNYEVDEKESVLTDGRRHGEQGAGAESCRQESCQVGYVVEGRQYRKYRVEERTPDGFLVGEYGVVRHEDGALRGVRYTADSDASPRLIYDALMKFLQLK